jgi:hypothetical protein
LFFSYTFTTSNYNFTFSILRQAVRCHTDSCTWPTGKIPCCGTKAEKSCGSKLFHLLLYPLGYNRARKKSSCAAIFLAAKMTLQRNDAATNKNAKTLRRIVNEMTNILVKMTDICSTAKTLASGTGFAYNDK